MMKKKRFIQIQSITAATTLLLIALAPTAAHGVPTSTIKPTCVACVKSSVESKKFSSAKFTSKKHVKYLTTVWAKAKSYTWSKNTTVDATLSAGLDASLSKIGADLGLSVRYSQSYSVGITVPANSKKFSKLALKADFNKYKVGTRKKISGKAITKWKYADYYAPIKNRQYLVVQYQ